MPEEIDLTEIEFTEETIKPTRYPQRVGGMATPLGVYLTTGVYSGGAGLMGLFLTGSVFALFFLLTDWLTMFSWSIVLTYWPALQRFPPEQGLLIQFVLMILFLLLLLRLSPLSGFHAAEHKTVFTIEAGEALTLENIAAHPREHPRCGTNLMFLLLAIQLTWLSYQAIHPYITVVGSVCYLFVTTLLITKTWRPMGLWIQHVYTTKAPTLNQIQSAQHAGLSVLKQFEAEPHETPTFLQRLWHSGLPAVLVGYTSTHFLLDQLLTALLQNLPA